MARAAACSLAANHLYEQPRCPVPHTVREVLLPCDVIQLLASDVGATAEEPVGQPTMQRLAVLRQAAVQLGHPRSCLLGRVRPLPGAAARLVGAIAVEAVGRAGAVLTVEVPLGAPQPSGIQADRIGQRLHPPGPGPVSALHSDRDATGSEIEGHPAI